MKRRFKDESDLEQAAQRRGFSLPPAAESPPTPKPVGAPPPPPAAPQPITVAPSVDPGAVEKAMQLVAQSASFALQQSAAQNDRVVEALERRLAEASVAAGRPLRWRVRVVARDYEGRLSELDIAAMEPEAEATGEMW